MPVGALLLIVAVACSAWGVVSAMLIVAALEKRGISTSFVLLRLRILSYVHQYRRLTLEESGRAGGLFYSFIISMNLALVAAVAGAIALAV